MGDIQEMFHQVEIFRKRLRFSMIFLVGNGDLDQEPKEYKMKV